MFKNYLDIVKDEDGSYIVLDTFQEQVYTVPPVVYSYALQLTGDRDPLTVPGYTESECRMILRELRKAKLVRQSRVLEKHFGTIYFTLIYKDLNERFGAFAKIWNNCLLALFIPVLVIGLICYYKSYPSFDGSIWGGFFFGLIIGLVCHEFSHGVACIAYGGTLHEAGIMIQRFIPGAYVLIEPQEVKGKLRRVQVYAAGVECNVLLCGLFFLLAAVTPIDGFFFMAGLENALLAALNLCFITGLDGSQIINELLGSGSLVFHTKEILLNRKTRRRLLRHPSGAAILLSSVVITVSQISLPLLIIDNILGLLEVFS